MHAKLQKTIKMQFCNAITFEYSYYVGNNETDTDSNLAMYQTYTHNTNPHVNIQTTPGNARAMERLVWPFGREENSLRKLLLRLCI